MSTVLRAIALLTLALGLSAITWRGASLYRRIRGGQPITRSGDLSATVIEIFGHSKLRRFTLSGFAHWFVMIGFVALFGTLTQAIGQLFAADFVLPVIGNWSPYRYFTLFIAYTTGAGILLLILIRQLNRWFHFNRTSRFLGSKNLKAYYVEATIVAVVICVLLLDHFEHQQYLNTEAIQIVASIKVIVSMLWFIVIASDFTMGVAWHRFLAPFNVYFKRRPSSLGPVPEMISHGAPLNFEDPKDDDVFGIGKAADISWKGLLDMASCTECGRCQSQCPAWHTEKPLSPKLLIMAMRDHALQKVPGDEKIVGTIVSQDVLWSCTTCGACVTECPVDIEHLDHITNMRRYQVLVESEFPTELGNTFKNLEKAGNPWGANRADRDSWMNEVSFPIRKIEGKIPEDIEYLFWVGCAGAFEERAKKTTKAVAELLYMSGVSFGVLGKRETCTGDPARRAGNEFLYQILARENIETFTEVFGDRPEKKVVVTCPHCFTTIGRDYRQQGYELKMVHHSQLLNELVKDGKLKVSPHKAGAKITFHDPCYLGRHNQIYQPPRELLAASGAQLIEMDRNQERSFCCGAGGGRMWQEEKLGSQINLNRVDEAIKTGADQIAVGCPFCRIMISDGVAGRSANKEVLDLAQVLLTAIKS